MKKNYLARETALHKALLAVALCACVFIGSCSTGENAASAAKILGESSSAPLFLDCRAVAENQIEFTFSQPVNVVALAFEPELTIASLENGDVVKVTVNEIPAPGQQFIADILAEDEKKNTINVLVPFKGRNNRMPKLVINELRTEYSNPRVEFIEFKMITAGNLGAMRVFIAGGSQKPVIYEFSPVEVKAGEFVVLHLRKVEADCKDEYGENLSESGGRDASTGARDIWVPDTAKLINKAAGVVYVMDQDDLVIDAIMHSETADAWWSKDYLSQAAEFLFSQGAWKSPDGNICRPADAIRSSGVTATRTICRDETVENTNSAADWYITATSGSTPGKPNDPRRYAP